MSHATIAQRPTQAPPWPKPSAPPVPPGTFAKRHPLLAYCSLVFAFTWGGILLLVGPGGVTPTAEHLVTLLGLGYVAMLAGATLAALLLTALVDGRAGLHALRARVLHWRVGWRWYAAAVLVAPLTMAAVLLILALASPQFLPRVLTEENRAGLLQYSLVAALLVGVFEELGWTGFAVPVLRRHHGVLATGLVVGVLHAAWTSLIVYLRELSIPTPGTLPLFVYLLVGLFSWQVAYRLLLVWAYDRTGSLLVVILMATSIVASWTSLNPLTMTRESLVVFYLVLAAAWGAVVAALAAANAGQLARRGRAHDAVPGDGGAR